MKTAFCLAAGAALLAAVGCGKEGSSTAPPKPGQSDARKLTVKAPGEQSVTQGETAKFTVSIDRTGFAGDVDIDVQDLPAGVTKVNSELMTIPAGRDSLEVTVKADPGAKPVEDHVVKVVARPKGNKDLPETTPAPFKMDVKAKS